MDAIERLTQMLDQKDEELEKKDHQISELESRISFGVDWMVHQFQPEEEDTLPIPRIELAQMLEEPDYTQEWRVALVMPGRNKVSSYIPYCYSKTGRTGFDASRFPTTGQMSDYDINALPGCLNDACFLMEKTGLPAYVVIAEDRIYKVTALRPLALEAIPAP